MIANNFNEEFFLQIREQEAWKELSGDSNFCWNEQLLERYKDKVDWEAISNNTAILWSPAMIEKFKSKIDWDEFSRSNNCYLYSVDNLRKFKTCWNWKTLSSNSCVEWNYSMIDEFADLINWAELIDSYSIEQFPTQEFFEKYKSHFPASSLQNSRLWSNIMDKYKKELAIKILSDF